MDIWVHVAWLMCAVVVKAHRKLWLVRQVHSSVDALASDRGLLF